MELPDRNREAPSESKPEQRAAFFRALALAERFAELSWTLAERPPPAVNGDDPGMAAFVREAWKSELPGAVEVADAQQEVDSVWPMLEGSESMGHTFEDAIARTVLRCATDDRDYGKLPVSDGLRYLATLYPQGARISASKFQKAVDAATIPPHLPGASEKWTLIATIIAEVDRGVLKKYEGRILPADEDSDRISFFAKALAKRFQRKKWL